jgi:hypothetical protein
MTDTQAPAEKGELIDIGTVAAHNIVNVLGLAEADVTKVRDAIRDEISQMGSHFSLAMADVQTQMELEAKKLESRYTIDLSNAKADLLADYSFVKSHWLLVSGAAVLLLAVGAFIGHLV